MRRRFVLASCALLVACGPVFARQEGVARDAIVGGTIDLGDPQVFHLKIVGVPSGTGSCSATLIGARTLLTAAHCVDPRRFGATSLVISATHVSDISTAGPADTFQVVETRLHPGFGTLSLDNDIAVALLEQAPGLVPKEWNAQSVATFGGRPLRAVGYGTTGPGDGGLGIKREVALTFRQLTPEQIWIGDQLSKGICSGDSGGPSFHLFADGVERVVGVHSTSSIAEACLDGTDQRVDPHAAFVRTWLLEKEPAACWPDDRCVPAGCASVDLDCVCSADGRCSDACPNLLRDPDCPADCVENGVCSGQPCPRPDVDCGNFTGACTRPQDCLSGRCVTDPQHLRPYCSASCTKATDCLATMECDPTGTCRYRQLPTVSKGALCTPGQQLCEPGAMCLAEVGSTGTCRAMCSKDSDCSQDAVCTGDSAGGPMFCRPPLKLPTAKLQGPVARLGCSASAGGLGAWVALGALLRRRASKRQTQ
ncbi:MAG: hypothetical protein H6Q89_871 [Myxococcaceae bacterium]|nr:hypothetical protein [Myxococcaceae bacterium]